jgi:hypothetical protein
MAQEFQKRDIFSLSETELKNHMREIAQYRLSRPDWPPVTANECNYLLLLAHGELQNRSTTRMGKIAIAIAVVSALITAAGLTL